MFGDEERSSWGKLHDVRGAALQYRTPSCSHASRFGGEGVPLWDVCEHRNSRLKKQTEEDVWSRLTRSGREAGMIIGRS